MRAKSRPNQKSMGQPISDIIEQRQFKTYLGTLGITLPEFRKQNYKARTNRLSLRYEPSSQHKKNKLRRTRRAVGGELVFLETCPSSVLSTSTDHTFWGWSPKCKKKLLSRPS